MVDSVLSRYRREDRETLRGNVRGHAEHFACARRQSATQRTASLFSRAISDYVGVGHCLEVGICVMRIGGSFRGIRGKCLRGMRATCESATDGAACAEPWLRSGE